ncbi:MAG: pentapeptide repeat-containing protein [Mangrovimonas sp.]|nr:pentapeptide repeat-containing protein [Mangrovimonas sp.]
MQDALEVISLDIVEWLSSQSPEILVDIGRLLILSIGLSIGFVTVFIAITRQRLGNQQFITDAFNSAIEKLGHNDTSVRIGALYALEKIAHNSPKTHYWPIMQTLCAYIREYSQIVRYYNTRKDTPNTKHEQEIDNLQKKILRFMVSPEMDVVPEDIYAAFLVLGQRQFARVSPKTLGIRLFGRSISLTNGTPRSIEKDLRLDLRDCWLPHFHGGTKKLNFSYAIFGSANFSYARLSECDFSHGLFFEANFECAVLRNTSFKNTALRLCDFQWARMFGANLSNANVSKASFHKAEMKNALLTNAFVDDDEQISADEVFELADFNRDSGGYLREIEESK